MGISDRSSGASGGATRRSARLPAELTGRVAVVTGAGGGIGRATALALSRHGVAIVASDLANTAEETAAAVRAEGGRAIAVIGNVAQYQDMLALGEAAVSALGQVDILVACAGVDDINLFVDGDVDRWQRVIDTNVFGLALTVKAILPLIQQSEMGHVVIMASLAGRETYAGEPIYIASKWAAVGLGGALRKELKAHRIRVTLIEPGIVDTPMVRATEAGRRELSAIQPLAPDDVARAVVFAVSQPSHVNVHEILLQSIEQ
jgi:NADP-dependent 3-hydroxy acid dehydrogenase YdfG